MLNFHGRRGQSKSRGTNKSKYRKMEHSEFLTFPEFLLIEFLDPIEDPRREESSPRVRELSIDRIIYMWDWKTEGSINCHVFRDGRRQPPSQIDCSDRDGPLTNSFIEYRVPLFTCHKYIQNAGYLNGRKALETGL